MSEEYSKRNLFPYGTAEHLAYEMQTKFGVSESAFVIFMCDKEENERNIAFFLNALMEKFGHEVAQWAAVYLEDFDVMPTLMPETKERVVLMRLDFDSDNDPDLKRFRD